MSALEAGFVHQFTIAFYEYLSGFTILLYLSDSNMFTVSTVSINAFTTVHT